MASAQICVICGYVKKPPTNQVERIFSIVETGRLPKRNTYAYLVPAVTAHPKGKSAPNLLDPPAVT